MDSHPGRIGRERGLRLGCLALVLASVALRCSALPPGTPDDEAAAQPDRIDRIDGLVREFFDDGSYPSLVVGLVEDHGLVYDRALGVADRATGRQATNDTIYEIGSVGKTLTASVLAILHDRGVMRIDDPLERWLPEEAQIPAHPGQTSPMTLEHLATHTSGLPNSPDNVSGFPTFQWRGYSTEMLFDELRQTELVHPPGTDFLYSNVGMGLLGHLMARASGKPYEQLVEDELLRPLRMTDTVIELDEEQRTRYAVGYETGASTEEAPHWEYGVLAGCGSHRSTVTDLARYLTAQWQGPSGQSIARSALAELHRRPLAIR